MALSNAELAQKIEDNLTAQEDFVTQVINWLTSQDETVVLTDPTTTEQVTVKTPYQLAADYDAILGGAGSDLANIEQMLIDAQTALDNATAIEANVAGYDATFQTYLSDAQAARDKAQDWAEEPVDVEVDPGKFSALHHATKAAASDAAAAAAKTAAETAETNAATSATNAATSETNAGTSATNAATSESNAAASETKASEWADKAEDVEVIAGRFSAFHWAQKAEDFALQAGGTTLDGLTDVDVTGVVTGDQLVRNATNDGWEVQAPPSAPVSSVAGKTGAVTLVEADITDLGSYALTSHNHDATYAALSHTHTIANVTGLQAALDGKSDTSHNHDAAYAAIGHNHDATYAPLVHTHGVADFDNDVWDEFLQAYWSVGNDANTAVVQGSRIRMINLTAARDVVLPGTITVGGPEIWVFNESGFNVNVKPAATHQIHHNNALLSAGTSFVLKPGEVAIVNGRAATVWALASMSDFSGSYNDLTDKPDLSVYLTDAPSNGSEYVRKNGAWAVASGGTGATNLSNSRTSTSVTVESDTGTNTTISAASSTLAGVMRASDKSKLDGIESGADVTDATNVAAAGAIMGTVTSGDTSKVTVTSGSSSPVVNLTANVRVIKVASTEPSLANGEIWVEV